TTNLGPSLSGAGTGLQGLALAGTNAAGQYMNGGLPANIVGAYNNFNNAYGATNSGFSALLGYDVNAGGSAGALLGAGANQLNNPLIAQAQGAAGNLLGTAGSDFDSVYQNQLANLQQQLKLPQQLQMNALQSGEFARGQLGTSGGALQTQAMSQGFGQADLAAAQQAYQQALMSQNSATQNAGILGTLASNQQLTGANLLGGGISGLGNLSFGANFLGSNLSNLAAGNLTTQSNYST